MFEKLWGMLQELENANGSKAKSALIKKFAVDADFIWMVKMALDQGHSFGMENFLAYEECVSSTDGEMILALEDLKTLSGVNDEKASQIYRMMCSSEERYNVVSRILRKDLRCGVAAKTINKVVPGLVFRVSYQRCATADHVDKIKYKPGAILQLKANGMFAYLLPDGSFMTRKGERCSILGNPVSSFVSELPDLSVIRSRRWSCLSMGLKTVLKAMALSTPSSKAAATLKSRSDYERILGSSLLRKSSMLGRAKLLTAIRDDKEEADTYETCYDTLMGIV